MNIFDGSSKNDDQLWQRFIELSDAMPLTATKVDELQRYSDDKQTMLIMPLFLLCSLLRAKTIRITSE